MASPMDDYLAANWVTCGHPTCGRRAVKISGLVDYVGNTLGQTHDCCIRHCPSLND